MMSARLKTAQRARSLTREERIVETVLEIIGGATGGASVASVETYRSLSVGLASLPLWSRTRTE